ncbi:uncharacterized protein LOC135683315 [Rhopilema esculentum]|uniref:uncharacterized protein LOC135683315 n=1 Tax=Rhopilema esculentum TaxID=499914 RepID=UPI0031D94E70
MNRFKNVTESREKSIDLIQNESLDKAVQQNRLQIASIAKCVLLFARQNIPFRGHRDDSQYYDTSNCGNFQALLDFHVESDDRFLAEHFKTAPQNATFKSKTVQSELISCIAEVVNHQIIKEIKECGPYSILADEVTDCSNQQQMPLVLRNVDGNGDMKERFMKYITCDTGTTGDALKTKILNCITNDLNLNIMDCRGQCDGHPHLRPSSATDVFSRLLPVLPSVADDADQERNYAAAVARAAAPVEEVIVGRSGGLGMNSIGRPRPRTVCIHSTARPSLPTCRCSSWSPLTSSGSRMGTWKSPSPQ